MVGPRREMKLRASFLFSSEFANTGSLRQFWDPKEEERLENGNPDAQRAAAGHRENLELKTARN